MGKTGRNFRGQQIRIECKSLKTRKLEKKPLQMSKDKHLRGIRFTNFSQQIQNWIWNLTWDCSKLASSCTSNEKICFDPTKFRTNKVTKKGVKHRRMRQIPNRRTQPRRHFHKKKKKNESSSLRSQTSKVGFSKGMLPFRQAKKNARRTSFTELGPWFTVHEARHYLEKRKSKAKKSSHFAHTYPLSSGTDLFSKKISQYALHKIRHSGHV